MLSLEEGRRLQKGEFEVKLLKTHMSNPTLESLIQQAWTGWGDVGMYSFMSTTDRLMLCKG